MPMTTTSEWLMIYIGIGTLIATIIAVIVAILAWRKPKDQGSISIDPRELPKLYRTTQTPTIHATSGTPSLHQLTAGIKLNAKTRGLAESLYELGLEQYNHTVNNRDGAIDLARREMTRFAEQLNDEEQISSEQVGIALAQANQKTQEENINEQYNKLSSTAKIYAQHKRNESEAHESIARDLAMNVPRTDYTSVKQRIASEETDLESVMTELPIMWQSVRELNEKTDRPEFTGKPPKRERFHVEFCMADGRILQDKRAEKDGDWLVSHKHGFLTPCPPPTEIWEFNDRGRAVPTGRSILVVDKDPSSEWDTEFWRQSGYMDQTYLRAVAGRLPHQLRKAYRQRLIWRTQWCLLGILIAIQVIIFAIRNL